jgi:membrane-associated phospholipid phosphatase
MNKRLALLIIGFIFLGAFYIFSREVKHGFLKQTDFNATVKIQDRMPKRFDEMWEDLAFFVTPGPSVVLVGLLTITAFVDIKKRKLRFRALIIPVLFGLLVMGEIYGKNVVHHPAPPFFMIKNPTTIFPKYYVNESYSYPSGHTARATFLGLVLLSVVSLSYSATRSRLRRWAWIVGIVALYIIMIGMGRIYLGQHWLSDVIGGGLLGGGLGVLILSL